MPRLRRNPMHSRGVRAASYARTAFVDEKATISVAFRHAQKIVGVLRQIVGVPVVQKRVKDNAITRFAEFRTQRFRKIAFSAETLPAD